MCPDVTPNRTKVNVWGLNRCEMRFRGRDSDDNRCNWHGATTMAPPGFAKSPACFYNSVSAVPLKDRKPRSCEHIDELGIERFQGRRPKTDADERRLTPGRTDG